MSDNWRIPDDPCDPGPDGDYIDIFNLAPLEIAGAFVGSACLFVVVMALGWVIRLL